MQLQLLIPKLPSGGNPLGPRVHDGLIADGGHAPPGLHRRSDQLIVRQNYLPAMGKCSCAKYVCARGGSPWFVFGAYIFALLPLAIVYALDFITEKWKTVKTTRREGYLDLFISVACLSFLLYFIQQQKCIENDTEMGAAISAVLLSAFHMARTAWGLIQLEDFKLWNVDALYALTRIGYPGSVNGSKDMLGTRLSRENCSGTIESLMVINNTLIDNTFFGTEVPIRLDLTCARLYSTRPEDCVVRWTVAFISRFGSKWLAQRPNLDDGAYTSSVFHGIRAALSVTRKKHDEFGQYVTALPLNHPFVSDRAEYGIYKSPYIVEKQTSLPLYPEASFLRKRLDQRVEFRSYETTIQEAVLSWDKRSGLRLPKDERVAVSKIKAEHLTCFLKLMTVTVSAETGHREKCASMKSALNEKISV